MTLSTQYALDTWRLQQEGSPPPPAPGTHEAKLLHAWWTARKEARRTWGSRRGGRTEASRRGTGTVRRRTAVPRRSGALRRRAGRA
ncbi:hypothetical protein GCM10009801_80990 [Streptomyces albiaxialis]|uniref:Helicase-associated domain-containing protein n=1 Tax=Streptomyces albiaxialis TaxID=329523 RepID=A0ABP5IQR0_9ACTN